MTDIGVVIMKRGGVKMPNSMCLRCQLANNIIETNTVYKNNYVTCILDIAPLNEGMFSYFLKNITTKSMIWTKLLPTRI
ncbi:hypothetical protein HPL003_08750 [Paenibacillus terrae HPL-003]|uniref:Uncharacterized protein n=1 Tax=Paenibacillus terrae (strain HPL-003) TaxID=985665 RepID=G7VYI5_PAETH|nr:hypothetical protein HPL003_08750 [Paenibacillus terrae HPL-003]